MGGGLVLQERPIAIAERPVPPFRGIVHKSGFPECCTENLAIVACLNGNVVRIEIARTVGLLRCRVDRRAHINFTSRVIAQGEIDCSAADVRSDVGG